MREPGRELHKNRTTAYEECRELAATLGFRNESRAGSSFSMKKGMGSTEADPKRIFGGEERIRTSGRVAPTTV